MNFEFMTIDTPLPPCMPFPRALTGFPVSSTAKVMYCRMLDAMLSNGQEDENGILFVCFPITAMQRLSRSHLYPARTGAWTPALSARCGAATIMWSCTADPTIPPYLEQSPLRNIRQWALHITTWRYNFAAKLEIPTRRHLLHPFRGEHRLGTAR